MKARGLWPYKEERHVLKRSRLLALAAAGVLAMGGSGRLRRRRR